MQVETFAGAAHWAPYLINGDASGLDARDVALCDAWHAGLAPFYVVSDTGEEPRFTWFYALHTGDTCSGGSVVDYVAHAPD